MQVSSHYFEPTFIIDVTCYTGPRTPWPNAYKASSRQLFSQFLCTSCSIHIDINKYHKHRTGPMCIYCTLRNVIKTTYPEPTNYIGYDLYGGTSRFVEH